MSTDGTTGRLAGKRALVTGAARGIGAAIARAFVEQGARVLLADIDEAGALAQARALSAEFGDGHAIACHLDVTSEAAWQAAVTRAESAFGGLSVLVNNAGIGVGGPIEATSLAQWRLAMAINAEGAFLGCRAALPLLRLSPPAAIVQIASLAGISGEPGLGAYSASKAALLSLTRTVAVECAKAGWDLRCNAVLPAYVDTAMLDGMVPDGVSRAVVTAALGAKVPAGRLGTAHEVAMAAVYLASDESRFMTGAELRLDGGYSAR